MSREQKKSILIYSFSGVILLSLMIFSGIRADNRKVGELVVEVMDEEGNYFTDDLEVVHLLTNKSTEFVVGVRLGELEPKMLEERVEANPFVREAQVFRDLQGNLQVKVEQSKPIARLFTNGMQDRYVDSDGRILPVNARHTARVPLLETEFDFSWENMHESTYSQQVFQLLQYIEADAFWSAQIAHVLLKRNGEVEMFPQVTKQRILFGKPEEIEGKFKKLMTFYKEILPKKGWNTYQKVNVKFENQIICE